MIKPKKKIKNVNCTMTQILLCGDVLKKVYGRMGQEKLKTGMGMDKKRAILALICENGFVPSEQEIKEGREIRK